MTTSVCRLELSISVVMFRSDTAILDMALTSRPIELEYQSVLLLTSPVGLSCFDKMLCKPSDSSASNPSQPEG